jgi:hypothetical protein
MGKINFLTIGDKKFFHTISLSVNQINRLYPDSNVFIYDWGFTDRQLRFFEELSNVQIIKWRIHDYKIRIVASWIKGLITGKFFSGNLIKSLRPVKHIRKENIFINKIFCFLDYVEKFGGNFVFLDGDAFLINRFDEIEEQEFDIGVTLRRKSEIKLDFGDCGVLNSGVIFFLGETNKNKMFLELWIKEVWRTNEPLIEQTSLSRMLLSINPQVSSGHFEEKLFLESDGGKIVVKILPCEIYNYNWIEEFDPVSDARKVKILHFKSGRFNTPLFKEIANKLSL